MATNVEADPDLRAFDLFKALVAITAERWVTSAKFSGLAHTWLPEDISAQVRFLIQVNAILRGMPVQAFADLDARQSALNALQEALDQLTEQEELQAPEAGGGA
jgi:type III secretion system TyeA family effector delivery regulator